LNIAGIGFENQESQFYPEASSSAQLLGFVGKDDNGNDIGYFGLEGYYNLSLSGKSGFMGRDKDAKGAPILFDGSKQISAVSGVDLVTSIDKRIQILAEEKLKEGIEKYQAIGGSITIMDPNNGEIIAMANSPSFDPQKYREYSNELFKNPVISNSFEPGSIFKVLVVAAGIDKKVIEPDTQCDICGEPLKLDRFEIKTWNNKYTPNLSMTDVIVNSDNVGMSFIGQKLGADSLYDYLTKFGIGKKTGIDLQGEANPQMRPKGTWNVVDLATASFGQGIAVTGIQMIRAVSAIANGGYLVVPHVVKSIRGEGWEEKIKIEDPQKIIGNTAAAETTQMMVQAVERGEAKWAKISGYKVAGKTGTAQIPVAGHYDPTNTNHSFIGFAPADKPRFIMLVTLQSPQNSPWAAETAAPL
jgi:cell division protein FtsI/penicillin-binding protein 2